MYVVNACLYVMCVLWCTGQGQHRSNSKRVVRALMTRVVFELCQATSVCDSSITLAHAIELLILFLRASWYGRFLLHTRGAMDVKPLVQVCTPIFQLTRRCVLRL